MSIYKATKNLPYDAQGRPKRPQAVVYDSDGNIRLIAAPGSRPRSPCWHSRWSKWRINNITGQQRRSCIQCSLIELRDSEDGEIRRTYA